MYEIFYLNAKKTPALVGQFSSQLRSINSETYGFQLHAESVIANFGDISQMPNNHL